MPDPQAVPAQAQASISNVPSTPAPPSGVTFDDSSAQPIGQPQNPTSPAQPPAGVTFDDSSTQPIQGSSAPPQASSSPEEGQPGLGERFMEHAVDPIVNLAKDQASYAVTAPIDAYHKAIEAYQAGDWKTATREASRVINTPQTFGIDKDSPIYKALSEIVMQPIKQVADSYKQNRAAGEGKIEAGINTAGNALNSIPNAIVNAVGNAEQSAKSGEDWAGILGSAVSGATQSVSGIPVLGGALAYGGRDFNTDMHDHNYMAAVGDVLGTIAPFGLGALGEEGEAAAGAEEPLPTTGVAPPPKPTSPNSIRPTTVKVAGVDIPQAAEPGTGIVGKAARTMRSMASEAGAKKFVEEQIQPAARQATAANFVQSGLKDVNELRDVRGEKPIGTPIGIKSTADVADLMHDEARKTYTKLDEAAQDALDEWEDKYGEDGTVTQGYQKALADSQAAAKDSGQLPAPVPKPIIPPKPKLFTELQDQIRNANRVADSEFTQQVDKQAAIEALPKYYAERTQFLNDHAGVVNHGELAKADKVYAKGLRYDWIADRLDALTKNQGAGEKFGTTGETPTMSIASLDKLPTMFDRKFGRDSFHELVGTRGARNFNAVEKALRDPKTGGIVQKMLEAAPLGIGKMVTIPASSILDRILFDPEFGETLLKSVNKVKEGGQAARDASISAIRQAGNPVTATANAAATNKKQVISNALGASDQSPNQGKPLTSLDPASSPSSDSTASMSSLPQQVQNAVSTVPVQITKGQPMTDPNGRSPNATVTSNVDQGAGNDTIEVNNPKTFNTPVLGHELTHVWQNNLPPSVQAKIPDDPKDMSAFDISDADKLRKQGKTLVDLPREKQATIVQKYIEDPKKNANLKPWVDDMGSQALSSTMPTAPDAKTLNMTPRPPGRPSIGVAGAYPIAPKPKNKK